MSLLFCTSVSAQQAGSNTPFSEPIENEIEIYPNPSTVNLFVKIQQSTLENVEFEIHSIIGNEIKVPFEEIKEGVYRIAINELNNGYYFVVVKDESQRFKQSYKFWKR
ncbi:MAG: T9SS type A sorting domain-containing protein [Bacteroidota bacterium]